MHFLSPRFKAVCVHGPNIGTITWSDKVLDLYEAVGLCTLAAPGVVRRGTILAFNLEG